jgi:hypothetical protein
MDWVAKFNTRIASLVAENDKAIAAVRRAYAEGRWQAATPAQRAHTRMNFRIRRSQIRRAIRERDQWIASHPQT